MPEPRAPTKAVLSSLSNPRAAARPETHGAAANPAPAPSDDEARLALRLRALFNVLAKRSRRTRTAPPLDREPAKPQADETGAEELAMVAEFDEPLALAIEVPEPIAYDGEEEQGRGARMVAPRWLAGRGRRTWRERAGLALSWVTTFVIVVTILGGAIIGLIGYGRSAAFAQAAMGRAVELGRVIGLFAT